MTTASLCDACEEPIGLPSESPLFCKPCLARYDTVEEAEDAAALGEKWNTLRANRYDPVDMDAVRRELRADGLYLGTLSASLAAMPREFVASVYVHHEKSVLLLETIAALEQVHGLVPEATARTARVLLEADPDDGLWFKRDRSVRALQARFLLHLIDLLDVHGIQPDAAVDLSEFVKRRGLLSPSQIAEAVATYAELSKATGTHDLAMAWLEGENDAATDR